MLTLLRNSVGSWVAKAFILLLVASFGVWGVSGAIVGGGSGTVVQVGKTNVSANDYVLAYERARFGFSRQFGRLLTRDEVRAFGIDANVLTQLVSGAVLDESARKMGLGLSNTSLASLIGEDAAFQDASGNFNRRALNQQLVQLGMNERDYVANRQAVAIRNQLLEGISANTRAPQAYINAFEKYRNEKRVFNYVTLTPDLLEKMPVANNDDLKKYYEANKAKYRAPEFRKLIIVKLEPEDVADPQSISPDEISDEYNARKSEFLTLEKRAVQQLTLESEAQGKSILERLKGGELFETILADLGKSEADIDIGEYTKGALPDVNVDKAAFNLKLNEVSEIVSGIFGPVILRVTQITPEKIKPLNDVEDDLRKRLALAKAGEELFDIHDKLEDERAAGDNLSEAARKVQLKIRVLDKIDAQGRLPDGTQVNDLPESAKLLRQAFDTTQGVEADPVSIGSSGFVWFEVSEIINERQKSLDEVKTDIEAAWLENATANKVEKIAQELKSKLASGDDFADAYIAILPESKKDSKVSTSAELTREDSSSELPNPAIRNGFAIAEGKSAFASGVKNGDYVVLKVTSIIASDTTPMATDEKKRLDTAVGDDLLSQMVGDLQTRADVTISQAAIAAAQNLIR